MLKFTQTILVAAIVSSGCTMIPKYERPATPVSGNYPSVNATNETHAAEIAWQDFIAEERLRKLVDLALANNRDLRVAVLNVEQSRAQYRISRSASFPEIDGGGGYTRYCVAACRGHEGTKNIKEQDGYVAEDQPHAG